MSDYEYEKTNASNKAGSIPPVADAKVNPLLKLSKLLIDSGAIPVMNGISIEPKSTPSTQSGEPRCLNCDGVYGDHWGPQNQCREGSQETWRYVHPSALPDSDHDAVPPVGMGDAYPEPAINCPILVGHLSNLTNKGGRHGALALALVAILDDVEGIARLMDHQYPADRHAMERTRHIAECAARLQALIPDIN